MGLYGHNSNRNSSIYLIVCFCHIQFYLHRNLGIARIYKTRQDSQWPYLRSEDDC